MRTELDILRDVATVSFHLLARYPFDTPDRLQNGPLGWQSLGLLHAELIALRDHEERRP